MIRPLGKLRQTCSELVVEAEAHDVDVERAPHIVGGKAADRDRRGAFHRCDGTLAANSRHMLHCVALHDVTHHRPEATMRFVACLTMGLLILANATQTRAQTPSV
jgi:hypothetical protein